MKVNLFVILLKQMIVIFKETYLKNIWDKSKGKDISD
jgi:hypothetical protein